MNSYVSVTKTNKGPLDTRVTTDRSSDGSYGVWLWMGDLVNVWLDEMDARDLLSLLTDGLEDLAHDKLVDARREEGERHEGYVSA